jgi:hypothetical protein
MIDKFGKNSDIHSLVMFAMGSGNRRFALELNRNLLILGEDEYPIILVKMFHTHREFCIENYPKCGFGHLINVNVADAERVHSNYEITTRTQVISHAFVKKNSLPYRFGKIIGSIFS